MKIYVPFIAVCSAAACAVAVTLCSAQAISKKASDVRFEDIRETAEAVEAETEAETVVETVVETAAAVEEAEENETVAEPETPAPASDNEEKEAAREMAMVGEKKSELELETYHSPIHFEEMQEEVNSEISAWLKVDGTRIDYPVMDEENPDGTGYKYNHLGLDGAYSYPGCLYFDPYRVEGAVVSIFGHNMRNGSMFGDLKHLREDSVWNSDPTVDLYFEDHESHLHPYLIVSGSADETLRGINSVATLEEFVSGKSVVQGSIPCEWSDTVVLVSCYGDQRTYVFCAE